VLFPIESIGTACACKRLAYNVPHFYSRTNTSVNPLRKLSGEQVFYLGFRFVLYVFNFEVVNPVVSGTGCRTYPQREGGQRFFCFG